MELHKETPRGAISRIENALEADAMQTSNSEALESQPYAERADELASVLCGLLESWTALPDSTRINIIRNVRRNLIDMACPPD